MMEGDGIRQIEPLIDLGKRWKQVQRKKGPAKGPANIIQRKSFSGRNVFRIKRIIWAMFYKALIKMI